MRKMTMLQNRVFQKNRTFQKNRCKAFSFMEILKKNVSNVRALKSLYGETDNITLIL